MGWDAQAHPSRMVKGQATGTVILNEAFWAEGAPDQGVILMHELLHIALNVSSHAGMLTAFNISTAGISYEVQARERFDAWLDRGCK
jgi:hypothetical protein